MGDIMTNDFDHRKGHRERLREKFLQNKLCDYELLELLLAYAIPRIDVKPIAKNLLRAFGGVREIMDAPMEKLVAISGIKQNTAIFIKALREVMMLDYKSYFASNPIFHDFKAFENYCKSALLQKQEEEFHVLYLDAGYRLILDELHSHGTIDWSAVYPREIVKRALNLNASIVILLHNHPTGAGTFSNDDIAVTNELQTMLKSIGIEIFDHFLVANGLLYSAKNMFLFRSKM